MMIELVILFGFVGTPDPVAEVHGGTFNDLQSCQVEAINIIETERAKHMTDDMETGVTVDGVALRVGDEIIVAYCEGTVEKTIVKRPLTLNKGESDG